jgi:hypothetical protein
MSNRIRNFFKSDSGAVTVDWVVLTAAAVGLAGAAYFSIHTSAGGVGTGVGNYLTNKQVN